MSSPAHPAALPTAAGPESQLRDGRPLLSVIVPLYNEVATLRTILERVRAVPIDKEVIVVDDGSTDGSRELAEQLARSGEMRVLSHQRNQGKTAALRTGIRAARGRILIVQDADLEYDPADYPRLVEPILQDRADVVYGSRFTGSPRRVLFFWHALGNRFLTLLSNVFTNLNLTDLETCYKAFRREVLEGITIRSNRFGFEAEVTAKVARQHWRIYEVPVAYYGRQYWEGKKVRWWDGLHAIWTIVRFGLASGAGSEDPGLATLQRVDRLDRYNRYLWDRIRPHVGTHVLEVGSGTGGMTRYLMDRERVLATDVREDYLALLRRMFQHCPNVEVQRLVLGDPAQKPLEPRFDTVLCSNVLEHIEDDVAALRQLREGLVPGGRLVLIVPMLQALYGSIDQALEHRRRYDREEIESQLTRAGFEVERVSPFNVVGIPGWWLNSRVLRRRAVPGVQARINNLLVPWLRLEDRLHPRVGMSVLAVGRRPQAD